MKRLATRAGIGAAVAVVLALNVAVVAARTGDPAPTTTDERSAKSASVGFGGVDEPAASGATTTTDVSPAPASSVPTADRTVTIRPPASTTTTTGVPPTTSTTVKAARTVDGPGLYVVAPDGTGTRRLASGYGTHSWSPDGTRLAWSDGTSISIIRADGSGRTTVPGTQGGVTPAWSPDGTRIAFGRSGAWVVPADGSGTPALVDPAGYLMAWTSDSRLVVMRQPSAEGPSIVVIEKDGSRRGIASSVDTTVGPVPSPDGRQVAYLGTGTFAGEVGDAVFTANVDGSGARPLTPRCCNSAEMGSPLAWSPDGRVITFKDRGDIRAVNADGTGYRVLVADAIAPTWSSAGRLAVIKTTTIQPGTLLHFTLQVVEAGGSLRMVFDAGDGFSVQTPAWSPTGRLIAVAVGTEGSLSGLVR